MWSSGAPASVWAPTRPSSPWAAAPPPLRRVQPGDGRHRGQHGRRAHHRPQRRGLPVLEGRDDAVPPRNGSGWAGSSEGSPAGTTRTSSSSTRARDVRSHRLCGTEGRHDRELRVHQRLPTQVRQPLPLIEPQAHHRLALRQLREAWEANRPVARGRIHPTLSRAYALEDNGQAACHFHRIAHQGKVGVLCLAPGGRPRGQRRGASLAPRGRYQPFPGRLEPFAAQSRL